MATFRAGDVVRVPFPYTDRETRQRRPALVVSGAPLGPDKGLLWVLMITSAANRGWPGDIALNSEHPATGLPVPSLIRTAKIATIDAALAEPIGAIGAALLGEVRDQLAAALALPR